MKSKYLGERGDGFCINNDSVSDNISYLRSIGAAENPKA